MSELRQPVIFDFLNPQKGDGNNRNYIYDPTFLTAEFYIEPNCILFNKTDSRILHGDITLYDPNDSFLMLEDKLVVTPLMLIKNLFGKDSTYYSRFSYFIDKFLYKINNEQWRLQNIEGLDTVFTNEINYKDGYCGSGTDKITITCLDDVNLSMYSLLNTYKQCVYDYINQRQILPNNILQFEACVIIKDVRDIIEYKKTEKFDGNELKNIKNKSTYQTPEIVLRFSNCHFELSSLNKSFDNISIAGPADTFSSCSFSFTYGKVFISKEYESSKIARITDNEYEIKQGETALTHNVYADNNNYGSATSLGEKSIKTKLAENLNTKKDQFGNEIESAISTVKNAPKKAIEENIFGAINNQAQNISQQISGVTNKIENAISSTINNVIKPATDVVENTIKKSTKSENAITKKPSKFSKFVAFNIYENVPSGPNND